jgi:hypothetical protein
VGPQLYSALRLGAFGTLAKLELRSLLEVYGTVGGGGRFLGTPQQAYLPGLN